MSTSLETNTETRLKVPSLYNVVLLNDDYTPMEFVIQVLREIFNKSNEDAYHVTMAVHKNGRAIVGTYTKEIADQKVLETMTVARSYKHPLQAITEKN